MLKRNDIELMSPAGSYESLWAGINAGADSIYFGAGNMNMRARSSANFSLNDLKKIADICRDNNVKSYLTLNTVIYDEEIDKMKDNIDTAKAAGVSAIIASDMAVINYCRKIDVNVHISTQLNVCNTNAVKFYSEFADVIVLARELNMEQVKTIHQNIINEQIKGPIGELIKIEMFAHGALCMSISGKCYLSLHENNASANRGACLQTCRKAYIVKEKESDFELEIDNEYIMSPKDLCTIAFLDKLLDAGVRVLKIEGRGRPPEYVKRVTECYAQAIQSIIDSNYEKEKIEKWQDKLATVFNRGFWDGYYLGRKLGEWSSNYGSNATKRKVHIGRAIHYYKKIKVAVFKIESGDIIVGDDILITGPTTGAVDYKIKEIRIDDRIVDRAVKGDIISMPIDIIIRSSDKLYKIVDKDKIQTQ